MDKPAFLPIHNDLSSHSERKRSKPPNHGYPNETHTKIPLGELLSIPGLWLQLIKPSLPPNTRQELVRLFRNPYVRKSDLLSLNAFSGRFALISPLGEKQNEWTAPPKKRW
ncbi:hypothetical protein TNIN_58081 [Trichonephila inaurata madagascariensis]|uniref:Uncharacterized protein n=1 Tax=Trichonephila inaurata madagascariensis TaxID=2747483 RepID=A0A8X6X2D7_9ARAC|nr:hypothetical protein TNIN_58081 [Trichonephila inaurata madagascariensis]